MRQLLRAISANCVPPGEWAESIASLSNRSLAAKHYLGLCWPGDRTTRAEQEKYKGWYTTRLLFLCVLIVVSAPNLANQKRKPVDPSTITHCNVPTAGTPACGELRDPGSSQYKSQIPHHVGNPIDVISGNKYQGERDYRSPSSGLTLLRHYNSQLSHIDTGIGRGWRHTYQVVLSRVGENELQVVQSDGRTIHFVRDAVEAHVFRSSSGSDGLIRLGDHSVWMLDDGRRLIFQGSWLVKMDLGAAAGTLTLQYRQGRLASVSDGRGGTLRFDYVPNRQSLPVYGRSPSLQPAGALASVTLPGGHVIDYRYGRHGNLTSVHYPDDGRVDYAYDNANWPSHLTRRQSSTEDHVSHWRYDKNGLGIAWHLGEDVNGLVISRQTYADSSTTDSSIQYQPGLHRASVVRHDGRRTVYQWRSRLPTTVEPQARVSSNGEVAASLTAVGTNTWIGNGVEDLRCDNCQPAVEPVQHSVDLSPASDIQISQADTPNEAEQDLAEAVFAGREVMMRSVHEMVRNLKLHPDQGSMKAGRIRYRGTYTDPRGDIDITLVVDREGKVFRLSFGDFSLSEMIQALMQGGIPACNEEHWRENPKTYRQDSLRSLSAGKPICQTDYSVVMELVFLVEESIKWEGRIAEEALPFEHGHDSSDAESSGGGRSHDRRSKNSADEAAIDERWYEPQGESRDSFSFRQQRGLWPWSDSKGRYCNMPGEMSCHSLVEDIEMAHLSRCAYSIGDCAPFFKMVDAEKLKELNLEADRFEDEGFNALLFEDTRSPGRYVLAFRGTDGEGDDWKANLDQARSIRTRQYDLAVQLARDVEAAIGENQLTITGHSLGGGLATAGAMATGREATVFNAASVQPGTADLYDIRDEYNEATENVRHIHTESDVLTYAQQLADDLDLYDFQTAPGNTLEINNPDSRWLVANAGILNFPPLVYHSISAVIHTLEQYWAYNCVV